MKSAVVTAVAVASLALLPGCATQQALSRATNFERQGRYRDALAQCEYALQLESDSQDARACIERDRPKAIAEQMAVARDAFSAKDYPATIEALDYVDKTSKRPVAEAATLRHKVHQALADDLDQALADKQFAQALHILDATAKCEPQRADAVAARKQQVRADWYDSLVERARAYEHDGHAGPALVLYLSANHVAPHAVARTQVARLATRLRAQGKFQVQWSLDGPAERAKALDQAIAASLKDLSQTQRVSADAGADFRFTGTLSHVGCAKNKVRTDTRKTEYVAGTVRVANPDYTSLAERVDALDVKYEKAQKVLQRRQKAYQKRRRAVKRYNRETLVPLFREMNNLARRVAHRKRDAKDSQKLVDDAQAQLDRLQKEHASQDAIDAQKDTVAKLSKRAEADQKRLDEARAQQKKLLDERKRDEQTQKDMEDARDQALDAMQDASATVETLHEKSDSLGFKLETTPKTAEQDVKKTFQYRYTTWERRCGALLSIDDGSDAPPSFDYDTTTRDEAHRAFHKYGVDKDPLDFPKTDAQLWQELDAQFAQKIHKIVQDERAAYYDQRFERARKAMVDDPDTATDMWLAVLLASPDQLEKTDIDALAEHLKDHYGASPMQALSKL